MPAQSPDPCQPDRLPALRTRPSPAVVIKSGLTVTLSKHSRDSISFIKKKYTSKAILNMIGVLGLPQVVVSAIPQMAWPFRSRFV
jgi:hypothetical protein